ncbi:MAG TPA: FeoA family protein [Aggregatilinea sp.]|jgi:Fe2+ transport system protein FeoA|uniref:FeoA family protein n=1 Tax=Aggregatilinea sp. TaxID=2806333 RepID=UPI002D02DED9|nr:FeoA family protein [Aggregatilinea sp.]HML22409.1 FeoA family protein [Aggregatilinea sp.]
MSKSQRPTDTSWTTDSTLTIPAAEDEPLYAPRTRALEQCVPDVDCKDCPNQAANGPVLPLCLVKPGQRVVVLQVEQERRLRKRLADLGLAPGSEVGVMRAPRGSGPMIVSVRNDTRLGLGWTVAHTISVRVVQAQ